MGPQGQAVTGVIQAADSVNKNMQNNCTFAIDAKVKLAKVKGTCSASDAQAFICTEEGVGQCYIYPFKNENVAKNIAESWWCCNVIYNKQGNEIHMGGHGFSHKTIRQNCLGWLSQ